MRSTELEIEAQIAARIRALRVDRGLTLDGLARVANVSRAMLSRIERSESSPTAQLLVKLCGGLGINLSALFAEAEGLASPLARRPEQPTWRDPASNYLRRSVSPPRADAAVDIVEVEFPPAERVAFDNQGMAGRTQHVWVLEGTIEIGLGEETFRLEGGDCLWMRLDRPILFRNPTERPARYAVIISRGATRS
jgi:transcriptional regulator with XRE-family HTH domain